MNQALECMYLSHTLYDKTHNKIYTRWALNGTINYNNNYLVEVNSIERL